MPMFEAYMAELNRQFGRDQIAAFARDHRDRFAPGQRVDFEFLMQPGNRLQDAWGRYFGQAPGSFVEALRGVIHYALSSEPPIPVTFAWAPGYDFELTLWQAADTEATRGGVTVLIKSRYPDDPHPARNR
jgi:hypothetical protein